MPRYIAPTILLAAGLTSSSSHAFVPASKVPPPAEPTTYTTAAALLDQVQARERRGGMHGAALQMAKKNKKRAPAASGKIQVKMLKYVEGTGSIGDIVMVTPAFFNNKLRPTGSAEKISDEAVAAERKEKDDKRRQVLDAATDVQSKIGDVEIALKMKAGPEGHLFGSVSNKSILKELQSNFPKGAMSKKAKIVSVKDEEGNEVDGDIKDLGTYTARIELLKDVEAKFAVQIVEA